MTPIHTHAKPFRHKLARCEVSDTTGLCKLIALPGQISLCFFLKLLPLPTTKQVALNETLANHKHQALQALSQEPLRFNYDVSLVSLITPCLQSSSHSCLLVRVSPNHNLPTMEDQKCIEMSYCQSKLASTSIS